MKKVRFQKRKEKISSCYQGLHVQSCLIFDQITDGYSIQSKENYQQINIEH